MYLYEGLSLGSCLERNPSSQVVPTLGRILSYLTWNTLGKELLIYIGLFNYKYTGVGKEFVNLIRPWNRWKIGFENELRPGIRTSYHYWSRCPWVC